MSNATPVEIAIGGRISNTVFLKLCKLANACNWGLEYGQNDIGSFLDLYRQMKENPSPLCLYDDQCVDGDTSITEEFCQQNKLSYVAKCDNCDFIDGTVGWWKPGWKRPRWTYGTQNGYPTVRVVDLQKILKSSKWNRLAQLETFVNRSTPIVVPSLMIVNDGVDVEQWVREHSRSY